MSVETPPLATPPPRRLKQTGIIVVLVLVCVVAYGIWSRVHASTALKTWTDDVAIPTVNVVEPIFNADPQALVLPGRLQAFSDAPIYARVSGYLKHWYFDIGAHVRAGQLLAEIETPDLDQQLEQAQADLASARANQALAAITAKRWQNLLASDSVSRQEADEKTGDLEVKTALAQAAKANVDRLQALESFKRIVAPFDGVVTARNTDVGDLISVGGASGGGSTGAGSSALFAVSDIRTLRVYVRVPQIYSSSIQPDMTATITVPEHPGQTFTAKSVGSASAIDERSGTMLLQLAIDNAKGQLLPGGYAEVHMDITTSGHVARLPGSTIIFRDKGLEVATVDTRGRVQLKPVTMGEDLGTEVEIVAGLNAGDRIIDSPPDSLQSGDSVRVAEAAPDKAPTAPASPASAGHDQN